MKIKEILSQNRRDFTAKYICESCGNEEEGYGYDDNYFHKEVIPNMICKVCGMKAGAGFQPNTPKYPDGFQV